MPENIEKPKRKRGRPPLEFDQEQFEKLCALQCTLTEIASWFNTRLATIEEWCWRKYGQPFHAVFEAKRGPGLIALRRHQWRMAETNPAMAIFLGKQYLGQTDKSELSGPGGTALNTKVEVVFVSATTKEPRELQAPEQTPALPGGGD